MRTALDSNILSALWTEEPSASGIWHQLGLAQKEGALVLSPIAYAELLAYPNISDAFVDTFIRETGIVVDFGLQDRVWSECGRRFAKYAERRRKSGGSQPKRLIADFLVGAHALLQAERLMTLDTRRYALAFPDLRLYPVP